MSDPNGQNPLFIPGPTNIPDKLRAAMNVQTSDHRAPDFQSVLQPIFDDLKKVFGTRDGHVLVFPGSGTGGWEAAITNTLSPGDKVLIARYGMFSHRWIDLCQRHRLDVEVIECEWGTGAPADKFATRLGEDRAGDIKAVLVTHNETATGVCSDVSAVRAAIDASQHDALLLVDCVSSLASVEFDMDAWGVDIAVSGSQKGFMLATGLAVLGVSQKALKAMESARSPRCYFDFKDMLAANAKGNFPYTPSLPLLKGLQASLDMLLEEGLPQVYQRHRRIANGVRAAVNAWGFELCAKDPGWYSDTVSAIFVPKGFNSNELTNHAYEAYGVSYGIGLGEMDGKAFRIGHLGSITDVMALSGIATIEMAMKDLHYPIELGSGVAAAQEIYRQSLPSSAIRAA